MRKNISVNQKLCLRFADKYCFTHNHIMSDNIILKVLTCNGGRRLPAYLGQLFENKIRILNGNIREILLDTGILSGNLGTGRG